MKSDRLPHDEVLQKPLGFHEIGSIYVAALASTSRLEAAMPEGGQGYELDVIAAVVMGGTSLAGGKASLVGTAIGAVLMAVVRNGLNLLNVNTFWHQVVIGALILVAVSADRFGAKRAAK
jgi:ribose transport system permease protein